MTKNSPCAIVSETSSTATSSPNFFTILPSSIIPSQRRQLIVHEQDFIRKLDAEQFPNAADIKYRLVFLKPRSLQPEGADRRTTDANRILVSFPLETSKRQGVGALS